MWHVCQGKPGFVRLDVDNKEYHMYICPWGADVAASELARALSYLLYRATPVQGEVKESFNFVEGIACRS